MKILLGSNSPRRKELLQSLGFDFEVVSINCDEIFPENLEVEKIASFLSELKANAFRKIEKDEILLTADTVVTFENKVLGKPKNREEAVEMLQHLSGKTHQVYTGISFKTSENIRFPSLSFISNLQFIQPFAFAKYELINRFPFS